MFRGFPFRSINLFAIFILIYVLMKLVDRKLATSC